MGKGRVMVNFKVRMMLRYFLATNRAFKVTMMLNFFLLGVMLQK